MMTYCRTPLVLAGLAIGFVVCAQIPARGDDGQDTVIPEYDRKIKPFIQKNCLRCHGPKKTEGEMRLDQLSPVDVDQHTAETWQEVLDVLNTSQMPPADEPQPSPKELADVIESLTNGLHAARQQMVDTSHITIRRLNRREYQNTIREILGVSIETKLLPEDGKLDGFDTVGDAQNMSAVEFEKYLQLGRVALDRALITGPRPETDAMKIEPEVERNKLCQKSIDRYTSKLKAAERKQRDEKTPEGRRKQQQIINRSVKTMADAKAYLSQPGVNTGFILGFAQMPFKPHKGNDITWTLPMFEPEEERASRQAEERAAGKKVAKKPYLLDQPGRYVVRFKVGLTAAPDPENPLYIEVTRRNASKKELVYSTPLAVFHVSKTFDNSQVFEVSFERTAEADEMIAIGISDLNPKRPRGKVDKGKHPDTSKTPHLWVDWMEVEGPLVDRWPPAAWSSTFFDGLPKRTASEEGYSRQIIERFAFRAFRHRKLDPEYINRIHGLYRVYRQEGMSFVDAVKESLAVVLASPSFVYLVEEPAKDSETHRQLSDLELASRLSYFLWSSPPDKQLYSLVEQGSLSQPLVLNGQVERMLNDPKARRFVEAFATQWLELEWLDMIVVNTNRFPDFSEPLRRSMREETIQFFQELVRDDLSAANLIDSDFVMIDDALAHFYGLDVETKPGFRRVSLPHDSVRGGLLGQGSILTMTATGERTSPVERGVFVYSRLLGKSVPPPPPNVPQLEISSDKPLTNREMLRLHIEKAQCASCHRRMDPLGFGLEHFDAIGQWRDKEQIRTPDGTRKNNLLAIDATGVMPEGKRKFDGHEQMKAHLLADQDQMAAGLMSDMLTYALGRRVGFSDGLLVEQMLGEWKKEGYGMRKLIHAIVQSKEFQRR